MNRTFIEVPIFTKKWKELGLTDDELRELQNILLNDPKTGKVIQGTGGFEKFVSRWETEEKAAEVELYMLTLN